MEIRNEHCSWTRPCDHVTVQFDRSTENTMNRVFFPLKCTRGPDDALRTDFFMAWHGMGSAKSDDVHCTTYWPLPSSHFPRATGLTGREARGQEGRLGASLEGLATLATHHFS